MPLRKHKVLSTGSLSRAKIESYEIPLDTPVYVEKIPFKLPSGHEVLCNNQEEYGICVLNAAPYVEQEAAINPEDWVSIWQHLRRLVISHKAYTQISDPNFNNLPLNVQKEQRALLKEMDNQITAFNRNNPLVAQRSDESTTHAEYRAGLEKDGEIYAFENLGQNTWTTTCPNSNCIHHRRPFVVYQQRPHPFFDFAAGPDVIWNTEIIEMVHLHYCRKDDCEVAAHRKGYHSTLTLDDAARILQISPFAIMAACYERKYDLGIPCDLATLDNVEILSRWLS